MSLTDARSYFWPSVHGFSVYYSALATAPGQAFLRECKAAGKKVCAWTVNGEEGMRDCARWGVESVITDKPALWRKVKEQVSFHFCNQNYVLNMRDMKQERHGYGDAGLTARSWLIGNEPSNRPSRHMSCRGSPKRPGRGISTGKRVSRWSTSKRKEAGLLTGRYIPMPPRISRHRSSSCVLR